MGVLHLFFGFSGRINRGKYWLTLVLWVLIWIIAVPVILLAALAILGVNVTDGSLPSPEDAGKFVKMIADYAVLLIVVVAFSILSWISGFAIGVKRLHDRGRSGWWILLFYVAPGILAGAGNGTDADLAQMILGLGALVLSIWGLVELGFLRGTRGPNRFGRDPLQRDAITAAAVGASKPAA
jgi:uncharacterized membrane protein YhaH (DUF805 family)